MPDFLPMRRAFAVVAFLAVLTLVLPAAVAEELRGRVVGISDGDTLTLLTAGRQQVRIRLSDIDTPERGQPYGNRAQQALSDLAFGKQARVEIRDVDRYGRTVGRIFVGTVDVSAELVKRGAAWVFRRYSNDPALLRYEVEARAARRGLWALSEAERVPPWEWRAAARRHPASLAPVP